jgi:hypothetical protein
MPPGRLPRFRQARCGPYQTSAPPRSDGIVYLGGHSSEALSLVSVLDFSRYTPRTYLVSEGDTLSEQKAVALEKLKATASASSLASVAFTCCAIYHTDRASLGIQIAPVRRIPGPHHSPYTARAPEPPHGPVHGATFATSRCVSCHPRPSAFPRLRLRPPPPKRTGDLLRALRGRIRQSR